MSIQNLSGQMLGNFQLTDLLGAGGMGAVYRARQHHLNREVAVKVLERYLAMQPGYLERFNREAQIVASLEHPNIVPVYDYGTQDDFSYVVMRLLTGGSLADRISEQIESHKPPSLASVSRLLGQIASALDYAHKRGVIHRDIKPGNVMFDEQGRPYLVDFGIAKLTEATTMLTQSGQIMGTPAYMPPEQWLDQTLTPATDQYALAILIYQMITGHLPFHSEGGGPYMMMNKHVRELPTPMREWRTDVPPSVEQTVMRALSKGTSDRYSSVTAFAHAFSKAVKEGATLPPPVRETIAVEPTDKLTSAPMQAPARRRSFGWGVLGVALCGVVALGAALLSSGGQQNTGALPTLAAFDVSPTLNIRALTRKAQLTETAMQPTETPMPTPNLTETAAVEMTALYEADLTLAAESWTPIPDRFQYELWGQTGPIRSLAYNADGSILASGSDDATIWLWLASGEETPQLMGHSGAIRSLAFYPDGSVLASASDDGTIGMWDVYNHANFGFLVGHEAAVTGVAFSPDGALLASSGDDGNVRLWDMSTWGELYVLPGYGAAMKSVAFSADGALVAGGSEDGNIFIWTLADPTTPLVVTGQSAAVNSIAFNAHGTLMASASDDGTMIVWDMGIWTPLNTFYGSAMRSVAFNPNGSTVVGAGDDGVVWLWELWSWAELAVMNGAGGMVWAVAISPDGGTLASGNGDSRIIAWGV